MNIKHLGLTDYEKTFTAMRNFTAERDADTPDELWLTQHHSVFTQGQAGKPEHLLFPGDIPVVQSDRGGQVTYHGPGQAVLYFLIDIKRAKIGVRAMVTLMEQIVIDVLAKYHVSGFAQADAPGVYVQTDHVVKKIASLGLRVRSGRTYHGLALNVDMDLTPFQRINPCGYAGLTMTQLSDLTPCSSATVEQQLTDCAVALLSEKIPPNHLLKSPPKTDEKR